MLEVQALTLNRGSVLQINFPKKVALTKIHMKILVQSLIRILGIFYCIKAFDTSAGSVYGYIIQQSISTELADKMPNVFAILLPTVLFYLMISVGLFLAAPLLSRLITRGCKAPEMECGSLDLAVITSSSLIVSAWVFLRLIDYADQLIEEYVEHGAFTISEGGVFFIISNLVILLAGFLSIKRMPEILKWLKRRSS